MIDKETQKELPRNRCPVCGTEFDDEFLASERGKEEEGIMIKCDYCKEKVDLDSLITEDDDYAWCI